MNLNELRAKKTIDQIVSRYHRDKKELPSIKWEFFFLVHSFQQKILLLSMDAVGINEKMNCHPEQSEGSLVFNR